MLSLLEQSGYNDTKDIYEKNKNTEDWLKNSKKFSAGKQGITGLINCDDKELVYKISQYTNYLVQHELTVMKDLLDITDYCPHFCRVFGGIVSSVNTLEMKEGDPFKKSKYNTEKEILLMEHIPSAHKLYNYISTKNISEDVIFSIIKQVLLAILIAQKEKKFTHYDLHSKNILIRKCDPNIVFLYVIDENTQYYVPTYGYYPVIIDFGFSYSESLSEQPLWPSFGHTDIGFTSYEFDSIADPKLFLVTVSADMIDKRKTKKVKKFQNIVRNIYSCLNIDMKSGWYKGGVSIAQKVCDTLQEFNDCSKLFENYDQYCLDVLQTLIISPIEKSDFSKIGISFITFLNEFSKIENEITSPFYSLYVLKKIVDVARTIRADYSRKSTRTHAVKYFRESLREIVNSVANFCTLKDIHEERMLCALYCFSRDLEGMYYYYTKQRRKEIERRYKKLSLRSIEDVYAAIDINLPSNYTISENTTIMVIDVIKEKCDNFNLSKTECDTINDYDSIYMGSEMYKIYDRSLSTIQEEEEEEEEDEDEEEEEEYNGVED